MSSSQLHTPKRLGSSVGRRLLPFLFVLAIGMHHATARLPPAPRQQLQTPYSDGGESDNDNDDDNDNGNVEIEQRRASLKAMLASQLQRASGRQTNATQRRPALVAPQPAVRLSKPRYVGDGLRTAGRLSANSNESDADADSDSDSISTENENDLTATQESDEDSDADAGDETDSYQDSQVAKTDKADVDIDVDEVEEAEEEGSYDPYNDNFYDLNADGSYVYGYSLPNGVRRYERAIKSDSSSSSHTHVGLIVEGFYAQPRQLGHSLLYELRCYRSDAHGYQPLAVEYLKKPPHVQRDEEPDVDCLRR